MRKCLADQDDLIQKNSQLKEEWADITEDEEQCEQNRQALRQRIAHLKADLEAFGGFNKVPFKESLDEYDSPLFSALEMLGRDEDPLSEGIERTTENLVRISYQHFPQGTEQVLDLLGHVDTAIDGVVEFIDDSTGNQASAVWQELDEITQARILGAGKVLSVLVPVAKVKGLAALGNKSTNGAIKSLDVNLDRALAMYNKNDIHHLFGRGGDIPTKLLKDYGSPESALKELQKSAQTIVNQNYMTGSWVTVKVGNIPVSIQGIIIEGVFRISTIAKREF